MVPSPASSVCPVLATPVMTGAPVAAALSESVSLSSTSSFADQLRPELFQRRLFAFCSSASAKAKLSSSTWSTRFWEAVVRSGLIQIWSWPLDLTCTVLTAYAVVDAPTMWVNASSVSVEAVEHLR